MTFGALAAWQAWLLLAAAAAVAVWLFLLKLRPPRQYVPSMLLWRRVLDESREETLWERIRRAVSLALTVLIAVLLAMAAARPSRTATTKGDHARGRLLVVIDSSLSMLARTNGGDTRWSRATAHARRLAASTEGDVALATTADGIVEGPTTDGALIDAALGRIEPAGGGAASWPSVANASATHFITDGATARVIDRDVVVHSVFEPAANIAITALDVRPSIDGSRAGDAYLEVANYARTTQQARIILSRGAATLLDRRVTMGAGESLRQIVPLALSRSVDPVDSVIRARVDAPGNALDADDEAFAWIERARPVSVAIVGRDTGWLRALFARDPQVRISAVDPGSYPRAAEGADVVIFDRWAPQEAQPRPALYFVPPTGFGNTVDEQRPRWAQAEPHPVVRGVDPFTLTLERARAYTLPDLVPVATSARGTPLVYVIDSGGRRAVVVTFGPGESNLTSAPGFPVLVGNALDWLATPIRGGSRPPGLASFDPSVTAVEDPRGDRVALARIDGSPVAMLRSPGLYTVRAGGSRRALAVNAGDPQVSNLLETRLPSAARSGAAVPGGSGYPWWVYCAIVAFVLALAEWWTWQRRITV
jgi:hypothetical protein